MTAVFARFSAYITIDYVHYYLANILALGLIIAFPSLTRILTNSITRLILPVTGGGSTMCPNSVTKSHEYPNLLTGSKKLH